MSKRLTKVKKRFFPKKKKVAKSKKGKKDVLIEKPSLKNIRRKMTQTKWVSPDELKFKRLSSKQEKRIRTLVSKKSVYFPDNYIVWHSDRDQFEIIAYGDRIRDSETSYFIGRTGDFIE